MRSTRGLGIDERLRDCLEKDGRIEFFPSQEKALDLALIQNASILYVSPNQYNKRQLGHIIAIQSVLGTAYTKTVYLCASQTILNDRLAEFQRYCDPIGIRLCQLPEDASLPIGEIEYANIILSTHDRFSLVMRQSPSWIREVRTVIVEDLHLLGTVQKTNVSTLEGLAQRLRIRFPKTQFVGFSDPFNNPLLFAKWLSLSLVENKNYVVPVRYNVTYSDSPINGIKDLVRNSIDRHRPIFLFNWSRKQVEELAFTLTSEMKKMMKKSFDPQLKSRLSSLFTPKEQFPMTDLLYDSLLNHVAYFHSGLPPEVLTIIETGLVEGWIWILVSSIPSPHYFDNVAQSVMIQNIEFSSDIRSGVRVIQDINVNLIHKILGLAGKYQLDKEAYGLISVDKPSKVDRIIAKLFIREYDGQLIPKYTNLHSRIGERKNLVYQILLEIADKPGITQHDLRDYLQKSLFYFQHLEQQEIKQALRSAGSFLAEDFLLYYTESSTKLKVQEIKPSQVKLTSNNKTRITGKVESSSRTGKWYTASFDSNNGVNCECDYFRYHGKRPGQSSITSSLEYHGNPKVSQHSSGYLCKHLMKLGSLILASHKQRISTSDIIIQSLDEYSVLNDLLQIGLIEDRGLSFHCTNLGSLVKTNLIAPSLLVNLQQQKPVKSKQLHEEPILSMITTVLQQNQEFANAYGNSIVDNLLAILSAWIHEIPVENIAANFEVYPGDLYNTIRQTIITLRVFEQISALSNNEAIITQCRLLENRLDHGVEVELLPLFKSPVPQLTRNLARRLFEIGIQTQDTLKTIDPLVIRKKIGIDPSVITEIKAFLTRNT